ncbi:TrkH family potassium uptake protein [Paenibacillus eucommiae]|uniref:Trk system potassium uptake protein TrkH n=1 Tax=Paenibacillus eucommiae TaxID=1355755 RepID=A0ABS4IRV7_9BACL|nr:TrkH family potassium uptake protein [Paenibacillus eucommiae]MBP1990275.1 trk system potassium uptake protein TrkH [Paenibacillus eucommiae]
MKLSSLYLKLTPPQILASGFAMIILVGTILLKLPISNKTGHPFPFIDALFTATSAMCVTGLSVVDIKTQFSTFGQIIILILVQLGGIGFMTMATWFAIMWRKRISLRDRLVLKESMNHSNIEGIVRLLVRVILFSITIEGTAAVVFAWRWSFEMPLGQAIYFGIFHAVSIFNNAGFDLFGGYQSLNHEVDDIIFNIISMILIILGGIGFIVMSDLIEYRKTRKLSLHSKVVLSASGVLILLGAVVIFVFEYTNSLTLGPLGGGGKTLASFFQSVSLRSAGTSTLDIASLREGTQFFMVVLMFIGAAPGSTGGGIKITTFTILIGAIIAMIRGKDDVILFRHRLPKDNIYKAITITLMALALVVVSTMILSTTQDHQFLMILFETTSAFGTVGLSMGLTPDLTLSGKILIILLMFIGRIGALTLAYALQPKSKKELYRHPEGKIIIG